jgi:Pathogenicity locus
VNRTGSDDLLRLRNIGPAMRYDLALLGIDSVARLARCDADDLYLALLHRTGRRHDPCVWDTFAAAIHQAQTGEALPWWHFTHERKARQAAGSFPAKPGDSPPGGVPGRRNVRKRA